MQATTGMTIIRNSLEEGLNISLQALRQLNKYYNPLIPNRELPASIQSKPYEAHEDLLFQSCVGILSLSCIITVYVAWQCLGVYCFKYQGKNVKMDPTAEKIRLSQDEEVLCELRRLQSLLSNLQHQSSVALCLKSFAFKCLSFHFTPEWAKCIFEWALTRHAVSGRAFDENTRGELESSLRKSFCAVKKRNWKSSPTEECFYNGIECETQTDFNSPSDYPTDTCLQKRLMLETSQSLQNINSSIDPHKMAAPQEKENSMYFVGDSRIDILQTIPCGHFLKVQSDGTDKSGKPLNIKLDIEFVPLLEN